MRVVILLIAATFALSYQKSSHSDTDAQVVANSAISIFENWLSKHKIESGAIAMSYKGQVMGSSGQNRSALTPAPVASLSKAITVICTVKLMSEKNLPLSTTLAHVLRNYFEQLIDGCQQHLMGTDAQSHNPNRVYPGWISTTAATAK